MDEPIKEVEVSPDTRYTRFDKQLEKGTYSAKYKAYDTEEGNEVAWTTVFLHRMSKREQDRVREEAKILSQTNHPNIISFYTSWEDEAKKEMCFITETVTAGSLKDYTDRVKIKLKIIKKWCRQILSALHYLHSLKIVHCDLNCKNIFVNSNGDIRVGHTGMCFETVEGQEKKSILGTPEFMAPEVFTEEYSDTLDVYSFGMCILEMVAKEFPWKECGRLTISKKVCKGDKPAAYYRVKNSEVRSFVDLCTLPAPYRPSPGELLEHPFLSLAPSTDPNDNLPVEIASEPIPGLDPLDFLRRAAAVCLVKSKAKDGKESDDDEEAWSDEDSAGAPVSKPASSPSDGGEAGVSETPSRTLVTANPPTVIITPKPNPAPTSPSTTTTKLATATSGPLSPIASLGSDSTTTSRTTSPTSLPLPPSLAIPVSPAQQKSQQLPPHTPSHYSSHTAPLPIFSVHPHPPYNTLPGVVPITTPSSATTNSALSPRPSTIADVDLQATKREGNIIWVTMYLSEVHGSDGKAKKRKARFEYHIGRDTPQELAREFMQEYSDFAPSTEALLISSLSKIASAPIEPEVDIPMQQSSASSPVSSFSSLSSSSRLHPASPVPSSASSPIPLDPSSLVLPASSFIVSGYEFSNSQVKSARPDSVARSESLSSLSSVSSAGSLIQLSDPEQ